MRNTIILNQYTEEKKELTTNSILLFALGDFCEAFYDDAKEVSSICKVALTHSNELPVVGFPYHAMGSFVKLLVEAGRVVVVIKPKK